MAVLGQRALEEAFEEDAELQSSSQGLRLLGEQSEIGWNIALKLPCTLRK